MTLFWTSDVVRSYSYRFPFTTLFDCYYFLYAVVRSFLYFLHSLSLHLSALFNSDDTIIIHLPTFCTAFQPPGIC